MEYKSLFNLWKESASKYGRLPLFLDALSERVITYRDAFRMMIFCAEFFQKQGLKKSDKVCLFADNSPEWLILEQAVISAGGVCVSKASDISPAELEYVYKNSDSCALITDRIETAGYLSNNIPDFLNKAHFVLYTGDKEINSDSSKIFILKDILKDLNEDTLLNYNFEDNPDDAAYINYTSGTSAAPKGAVLRGRGMLYHTAEIQKLYNLKPGGVLLSLHSLSSGWKSFNLAGMASGSKIVFASYKDFKEMLKKYKPDYLHTAPKVLQDIYGALISEVKTKGRCFEKLFNSSYFISKKILSFERNFLYKNKYLFLSGAVNLAKSVFDRLVFKEIRNKLFKDGILITTGSAHLSEPVEDFMRIMNIDCITHYGLTEITGAACSSTIDGAKRHPYTVGKPFSKTILKIINPETGKEVKQGETGLITFSAPSVLKCYYNNEEASKKALPDGSTLFTGDLGFVDKDGFLTVLSRYDDVIVLSNGYDVYPPLLDSEMKDFSFIKQSVIAGHGKPYLVSLIVLNNDEYKKYRLENNLPDNSDPNKDEEFKEFLIENINERIKRKKNYRYYEKIKKVYFLEEGFTLENGLITPTLKIKYKSVINKYKDVIESLYNDTRGL